MGIAVQYHWILDESVLYLGESVGGPNASKTSPIFSDTHLMRMYRMSYTQSMILNGLFNHQVVQYHWIFNVLPYT